MKGQVAFESLFHLLIVMSMSILITSLYLQTQDDTLAIALAKNEVLSELSTKKETIIVDSVTLEKSGGIATINIKISPFTQGIIDTNAIQQKIAEKTKYKNANILID